MNSCLPWKLFRPSASFFSLIISGVNPKIWQASSLKWHTLQPVPFHKKYFSQTTQMHICKLSKEVQTCLSSKSNATPSTLLAGFLPCAKFSFSNVQRFPFILFSNSLTSRRLHILIYKACYDFGVNSQSRAPLYVRRTIFPHHRQNGAAHSLFSRLRQISTPPFLFFLNLPLQSVSIFYLQEFMAIYII